MIYRTLGNTGLQLSTLGFGASSLGNVFKQVDESVGIRTVHTALDAGINLLDVSPYYGDTLAETVLGKALKGVDRDHFILSSKAGRYGPEFSDFDMSASRIRRSLEQSLQRLGVDELDILLLHDIEFVDMRQVIDEAIPCLQQLKQEGRVKAIGVTGYPLKIFDQVLAHHDLDCILTYCRYALYDTSLSALIPRLQQRGVGIINASPTGMGLLTERGAPDWHPASAELQAACRKAVALCQDRGVDITQLAMQFALQQPDICSTLVGTGNPENLLKNIGWIAQEADAELVAEVRALFAACDSCVWPSGYPENQD